MNSEKPKIAFLLGSGISFPAKLPSVWKITEEVLSGEGWERHSDDTYFRGGPQIPWRAELTPPVIKFVNRLRQEVDKYYQGWIYRVTTYEDIYYLAEQIRDGEAAEYENPAILALLEKLELEVEPIPTKTGRAEPVRELATEATKYIKDVVQHCLSKKSDNKAAWVCKLAMVLWPARRGTRTRNSNGRL